MKAIVYFLCAILTIWSCSSPKKTIQKTSKNEAFVKIANDSLQYEITIIDIGFSNYLNTIAKPMSFYSIEYLETKNSFYVSEWNNRFRSGYKPNLYENLIDYDNSIHYGLEVNYKLFNYFKFVESRYGERF